VNYGEVVVELFGVVEDSGTLQILDSPAFTNFICELVGSQNYLICSCVIICDVAFAFTLELTNNSPTIPVVIAMMMNIFIMSCSKFISFIVLFI
jgi:hypothetical protein